MKFIKNLHISYQILFLLGLFFINTTSYAQVASSLKGYNWADRRDNFQSGRVEPSGLADNMSDSEINALADRVCNAFKNTGNGNTIRFGINPATLSDAAYWMRYKKLIDRCINSHDMNIILAYWESDHDGDIDDTNAWQSMWLQVDSEYGNNTKVYMEPMNEPHAYSANALLDIYQSFRNYMTNLPDSRTLCGGTGYSEDVAAIGGDSRVAGCLLSLHLYHWFGSETNESGWVSRLNDKLGSYASRTVVTEWGSECTQGLNFGQSSSDNKVSYVRGMSQRINELNLGSIYWPGVRDNWTENGSEQNDWFRIFNSSSDLTVTNQSMMDRIHLSFAGGTSCTPSSITPYFQVNGGSWQSSTSVTIDAGDQIQFGPHPYSGGSWSWSGCGTSGSSREQTVSPTSSCTATAVYTNGCGAQSSVDFTITVNESCDASAITPYYQVNGGSWQSGTLVTIDNGDQITFGPQPSGGGSWSWSGCGTSGSSREQTISPSSSCIATAIYTNDCGAQSSVVFTITVEGNGSLSGIYTITNRNSGKCLTTLNGSTADAAEVVQVTCNGSTEQQWEIVEIGTDLYNIIHVSSGKFADIDGGSTSTGANNIIWPDNGGDNQKWEIVDQGDGYYHIINLNSNLFLDISSASTSDNANNIQWSDNGGQNQDWSLTLVSSSARTETIVSTNTFENPKEITIEDFAIYPNPTVDGIINIQIPEDLENSTFQVFSLNGSVVYKNVLEKGSRIIDLSTLSKGIYTIRIINSNRSISRKLRIDK